MLVLTGYYWLSILIIRLGRWCELLLPRPPELLSWSKGEARCSASEIPHSPNPPPFAWEYLQFGMRQYGQGEMCGSKGRLRTSPEQASKTSRKDEWVGANVTSHCNSEEGSVLHSLARVESNKSLVVYYVDQDQCRSNICRDLGSVS